MSVVEKEPTKQYEDATEWRICHAYPPGSDIARCGKKLSPGSLVHTNEECCAYHDQCVVCMELSPTWREFYGR